MKNISPSPDYDFCTSRFLEKENFQNRYIKFVECHIGIIEQTKFQVLSMFAVRMAVGSGFKSFVRTVFTGESLF